MRREIGGYIEMEHNRGKMLHEDCIALNCGRNCLAYIIEARGIKKIMLPYFDCDSVWGVCRRYGVKVRYYRIGMDFRPEKVQLEPDEWLYIVNYYGQLTLGDIQALQCQYGRLILDNAQAYFMEPVAGIDTIYTCRKFFGVADGGFLSTGARLARDLPRDESSYHMHFLMGRFERTASEFYSEYVANNERFDEEPVKKMSALTENILRGIDYGYAKKQREQNWHTLDVCLDKYNQLELQCPEGPFMYPLLIRKGSLIRKALQEQKIYIPTLWPDVLDLCSQEDLEYQMAENILPLPIDQRYGREEMEYMAKAIMAII